MWAMGAIMAELFTLRPLFPGARFVPKLLKLKINLRKKNHHGLFASQPYAIFYSVIILHFVDMRRLRY